MSIQWNVALCLLIPKGTPFFPNFGMSAICILKQVLVFVLQLSKRRNPSYPTIYLPLAYNMTTNSLNVYIPVKTASNTLQHLTSIDQQLKQFCEQFKKSGNLACVIRPAIHQMLTMPNLMRWEFQDWSHSPWGRAMRERLQSSSLMSDGTIVFYIDLHMRQEYRK